MTQTFLKFHHSFFWLQCGEVSGLPRTIMLAAAPCTLHRTTTLSSPHSCKTSWKLHLWHALLKVTCSTRYIANHQEHRRHYHQPHHALFQCCRKLHGGRAVWGGKDDKRLKTQSTKIAQIIQKILKENFTLKTTSIKEDFFFNFVFGFNEYCCRWWRWRQSQGQPGLGGLLVSYLDHLDIASIIIMNCWDNIIIDCAVIIIIIIMIMNHNISRKAWWQSIISTMMLSMTTLTTGLIFVFLFSAMITLTFRLLPPNGVPCAGRTAENGDGLPGRLWGDARIHRQLRLHLAWLVQPPPPLLSYT